MKNQVKFAENVMLIDIAFLNDIACSAKNFFSKKLGRELSNIDLPAWLSYLALDAGLREGDNKIQVILLYEEDANDLACCEPSDFKSLDGMACRTPIGEFVFSCITPTKIASCQELYSELMNLVLDSADVNRLMLVPCHPLYGDRVEDDLRKFFNGKSEEECSKTVYFTIEEPQQPVLCRWDFAFYSLAQAFGIKPGELQ